MTKMQISLPSKFIFSTDIPTRIIDVHGVHISYETFISFLSEARFRFFRSLGYPNLTDIDGAGIILTDLSVVYLKQGYSGQTLRVDIGISEFASNGFQIVYRVSDAETGIEMVRAKTSHLFYDYQQQKVTMVPQDFKKKVSN